MITAYLWASHSADFLSVGGNVEELLKTRVEQFPDARPVLAQHYNPLGYLKDVLKALEFLHGRGMVHNDIKGSVIQLISAHSVLFF